MAAAAGDSANAAVAVGDDTLAVFATVAGLGGETAATDGLVGAPAGELTLGALATGTAVGFVGVPGPDAGAHATISADMTSTRTAQRCRTMQSPIMDSVVIVRITGAPLQ